MHKVLLVAHVRTSSSDRLSNEVEFCQVPMVGDLVQISSGLLFPFHQVRDRYFRPGNKMVELHFEDFSDELCEILLSNDEGWKKSR